ncbi:phasin family protein [Anaerosalibacter massiliensis]|uniref:Phasin family protein n=1 Tax=Anaerosalibacter massiliensis TaxID=1347392 RepID=A0A9X2MIS8_9FIRM|nr:phasin family protein [Anaerosalibacter massiliensis]MCR2044291.1 phasin family protein [Anaerosalibacter massiliensis]
MDNTLKNIVLAGIGSMAYTYEKASTMVNTLVQKGELTVNQGKELNEELKKVIDSNNNNQNKSNIDTETLKNIIQQLNLPTKEDINELKTRIDNLEKNNQ